MGGWVRGRREKGEVPSFNIKSAFAY